MNAQHAPTVELFGLCDLHGVSHGVWASGGVVDEADAGR